MEVVLSGLVYDKLMPDLIKLRIVEDTSNKYGEKGHYTRVQQLNAKGRHEYDYNDKKGTLDLTAMTRQQTESLLSLVAKSELHGTKMLAADLRKYLKASDEGIANIRARTLRQAAWMLERYFAELPHHTVFSQDAYGGKSHSGYWVGDVDYTPEVRERDRITPEKTHIKLWWIENDRRHRSIVYLYRSDVIGKTCVEMLAEADLLPETPKLMAKLRAETERYYHEREQIGRQHIAIGIGLNDLDDKVKDDEDEDRRYGWRGRRLKLDNFGAARVVIDVYKETDGDENSNGRHGRHGENIDPFRWHKWNSRFHSPSEDELVAHLEADEDVVEDPTDCDLPVHPLVPCFDLNRHMRMRVHINNLTPYVYDEKVGDRLILPERDWLMVNLLVDHSVNRFQDIVANKGQSMNILSEGPPGTGKTATAEVFAEFKKRPLYTIQCSQLGLDADDVEKNLGTIMARANRWNAVLLLDEADVYIRRRGTDLNQNAIVGAFLRVLEYASCILFMTTNLQDQVDDAITSRCIARLRYGAPTPEDQRKIWRILADLNKIDMTDREIEKVAAAHPTLSGRDVKNLLKLASFMRKEDGAPVTAKMVELALQFKPTQTYIKE